MSAGCMRGNDIDLDVLIDVCAGLSVACSYPVDVYIYVYDAYICTFITYVQACPQAQAQAHVS